MSITKFEIAYVKYCGSHFISIEQHYLRKQSWKTGRLLWIQHFLPLFSSFPHLLNGKMKFGLNFSWGSFWIYYFQVLRTLAGRRSLSSCLEIVLGEEDGITSFLPLSHELLETKASLNIIVGP